MDKSRSGVFVTLEGPDGAGKSTQAARLATRVGGDAVLVREPGSTPIGERIRQLLLRGDRHDPLVDALLFTAARRQLVVDVIRPALERGAVVICDRHADSTLAYQGYGAGVPIDRLRALAAIATDGLVPHRTILFDLPATAGLRRRMDGAAGELTRFESADQYDVRFHERVRAGYLELAAAEPDRWRVVNAEQPQHAVADDAWRAIEDLLRR